MHRILFWLSLVGVASFVCGGATAAEVYVDAKFELQNKVRVAGKELHVYEQEPADRGVPITVVTDAAGSIVRDKSLCERAAHACLLYRRYTDQKEMEDNRKTLANVDDYRKWSRRGEVMLFLRDTAASALVEVSVSYLTGDPSQMTKEAAKKIARKAAKTAIRSTVENMLKNPDNYLRAVAYKMLDDCRRQLLATEREGLRLRGRRGDVLSYERLARLDQRTRAAYTRIVPAMKLISALAPGADVWSQVKDVLGTMKGQLLSRLPAGAGPLSEEEVQGAFTRAANAFDEIYKRYKPYREYQELKGKWESEAKTSDEELWKGLRRQVYKGLRLTRGSSRFSRVPVPASRPAPRAAKVKVHTFGPVTSRDAPKTFAFEVPRGFSKVEVSIDGNKYGGWRGWVKVNGQMVWKFLKWEKVKGGHIQDYVLKRQVLERSGKGKYNDVTKLCRPGRNTVTWYHFTSGPGGKVIVRVYGGGS